MTRDEIIKLMDWHPSIARDGLDGLLARVERVARAAYERGRLAENEACAEVCEDFESDSDPDAGAVLACAIRARRASTASPATLIDPRGSLGEPIV
jgi:hypothetical protein